MEQEIVSSESRTQLGVGSVRRAVINQHVPVQRFRLSIDAHREIPLQMAVHEIPEEALQRETSGKGTGIRIELGPLAAVDSFEFNVPPDRSPQKRISFSTGESWGEIATAYAKVVEEKIAGADVSSLLEGVSLTGSPVEVADRITAKLHDRIRYTGVEFAEAEIIPGAPAQTLARGYGDCKDKSTLLVALLRAAGLDAQVALLAAGSAPDVDPQLPGLGLFNHVIVYVDAEKPFWIDATAENTRVPFLPPVAEGRLALIAKPGTSQLTETPLSRAEDNWLRRTTTIRISDFGGASLHEITQAGGSLEAGLRAEFSSDSSAAREATKRNVEKIFQGELTGFEVSERSDSTTTFQVSVEITDADAISTGMEEAAVGLARSEVFEMLPFAVSMGISDFLDNSDDARKSDVWFDQPHRIERRYRIHPPALFKAVSLPEPEEVSLGPATYSQSVETLDDGSIEIVLQFDSGKRRWSPADVSAFQQAAKPYYSSEPVVIRFIPLSAELTALGETHAALSGLREYVKQHPDKAPVRARLSRLLIATSLGDAAKDEAVQATEMAPDSVAAWLALGWAHQHDIFGRRFHGDWDRRQAVAALRRAVELDPESRLALAELAILLEYDELGVRYGAGADISESIGIYEKLDQQALPAVRANLIIALIRAGRLSDAKAKIQDAGQQFQNTFGGLIKVLEEGIPALILDFQASLPDPGTRSQRLWTLAYSLVQMRRYDLALPIFQASARIQNQPAQQQVMQMLARMRRFEDAAPPADDPRSPVWKVFVALLSDAGEPERLKALFTTREDWSPWEAEIGGLRARLQGAKANTRQYGFEEDIAIDFVLSATDLLSDGSDKRGFRVHGQGRPSFLVIQENGEYRILGSSHNLAEVGKLVWQLVEDGDIETAQWWLDEAIETLRRGESSRVPPAEALWSGISDELRGPGPAKAAAAALVGRSERSELAIRILREVAETASVTTDRNQANAALAEALESAREWESLATVAQSFDESGLFASESFDYALRAARGSGDWSRLAPLTRKRMEESPDDHRTLRALAETGAMQQDLASVEQATSKLLEGSFISLDDLVFDAWMRRILGKADQERLSALQERAQTYGEPGADFYYTQAMMQAELGQPDEATQSLRLAVGDESLDLVGPKAWLIRARICELRGFPEAAETARRRARLAVPNDDIDRWAVTSLDTPDL